MSEDERMKPEAGRTDAPVGGGRRDPQPDGRSGNGPATEVEPGERAAVPDEPGTEGGPAGPRAGGGAEPAAATDDLANQYLDQLQRLRAEFDNYRKRTSREKEGWWRQAKSDLLSELLPVLDDVTRARSFTESQGAPDAEGLLQVLKKLVDTLTQLGLEVMETEPGTPFDPELHEALIAVPSAEIEEGRILATLDAGYVFEGQILRRSRVSVSAGPPEGA